MYDYFLKKHCKRIFSDMGGHFCGTLNGCIRHATRALFRVRRKWFGPIWLSIIIVDSR